jgi:hypothetical protein
MAAEVKTIASIPNWLAFQVVYKKNSNPLILQ